MKIKEIAKLCNTSIATVSRVLNNPDYKCSDPTLRDKIRKVAAQYDYIPNESARNLKINKQIQTVIYHVNIIITRIGANETDLFYNELLDNVTTELYKQKCIVSNLWYIPQFAPDKKYKSQDIKDNLNKILNQSEDKVDGIIIMGKCKDDILKLLKAKFRNITMIVRNRADLDVDEVLLDGMQVAFTAIKYLVSLGHKKIGYIGDCKFDECFTGYMKNMNFYQLPINMQHVIESPRSEEGGYNAMDKILQMQDEKPSAIFCLVDAIAIGAIRRLNERKNKTYSPSIIACDGIEAGKYTNPMLTTVESPKEDMARLAVFLLKDRLEHRNKSVTRVIVDGKLVIRGSCTPYTEYDNYIEYYI